MATGVAADGYALWLGSGISLDRVPGLKPVLKRVLAYLQERVEPGNPDCRFCRALNEVIGLAGLSAEQLTRNNADHAVAAWPDLELVIERLVNNYARVLDVQVDGEEADFLLWNAVDVPGTYANNAILPDAEHLCVALLALEGTFSDIASANWDGLVELAISELNSGRPALHVLVIEAHTREASSRPKFYKFHGCAVLARDDAGTYRAKLVARQSQINGWIARGENQVIGRRLVDIATTKRTLMIGLSAQDSNIQGVFVAAEQRMNWPWPADPPAYVFSTNALGGDQRGLLQNVYRAAYTGATRAAIFESALLKAYAKPLLVALTLHVLGSKISALAVAAPGHVGFVDRTPLNSGVVALRNNLGSLVRRRKHEPFMRDLIAHTSRMLTFFREGRHADPISQAYSVLYRGATGDFNIDPNLPASGMRELGVSIGLIGLGLAGKQWRLGMADRTDPQSGALRIKKGRHATSVFFAATSHQFLRLMTEGVVSEGADAVVVHSLELLPTQVRSPRGAKGRTGKISLREVSISDLMRNARDAATLMQRFREETAL